MKSMEINSYKKISKPCDVLHSSSHWKDQDLETENLESKVQKGIEILLFCLSFSPIFN